MHVGMRGASLTPCAKVSITVSLQIFGVVLFSIFSVVSGFSEINLFPAEQKTTWLSSLKICEKNNAENEKLNVFLQAMDILDYF